MPRIRRQIREKKIKVQNAAKVAGKDIEIVNYSVKSLLRRTRTELKEKIQKSKKRQVAPALRYCQPGHYTLQKFCDFFARLLTHGPWDSLHRKMTVSL